MPAINRDQKSMLESDANYEYIYKEKNVNKRV